MTGITQFCFTRDLPADAVSIAYLSSSVSTPEDLVDINNTVYQPASLNVYLDSTSNAAAFSCPDYNQPTTISGSTEYFIDNQFFELSNIVNDGVVYWYMHTLPTYIAGTATITDLQGNIQTSGFFVSNNTVYHNFYSDAMLVQYSDTNGYLHTDMLNVNKLFVADQFTASNTTYTLFGRQLTVASTGNYYIRFTQAAGFLALTPWSGQPNTPWYPRVRFPLNPFPIEWANQVFSPQQPYMAASFAAGTVLSSSIIEFERKDMYIVSGTYPDVLVYNSDYSIKYALDGSPIGSPRTKGNQYPWKRGLVTQVDSHTARVKVSVELDPTDIVYAFYQYAEPDVIYNALDINPFTNPVVKDTYIQLYVKTTGVSGLNSIFYQVLSPVNGEVIVSNDPSPGADNPVVFSVISVGASVPTSSISVTDERQRGGGLASPYQGDVTSVSCWDLGFWDGKPYPVSGGLLVYLPITLLDEFDRTSIFSIVQGVMPAGAYPVIKFYDSLGNEST